MAFSKKAFEEYINSDGQIEFDMYAQDPDDFVELSEVIPGLIVSSAGGMMPFQAEGLLQGYPFYFRAEWGYASLSVGARDGEKPYLGEATLWHATINDVEKLTEPRVHFEELMVMLVPKLKRSPFIWFFEGKYQPVFSGVSVDDAGAWAYTLEPAGEVTTKYQSQIIGWGFTAAEGYRASGEPSELLAEKGFSLDAQRQLWLDREVDPVPLNRDERAYPAVDPDFRVIL